MSAKSCLLCGRALSRMRMGAEGDFCSREHRNQYRLRRSMECLTEANKVATLARRRESPKPLFGSAVAGAPAEQRGFFQSAMGFGTALEPVFPSFRGAAGAAAKLALRAATAGPAAVRTPKLPAPVRREFGVRILVESSVELAVPRAPRKPAAPRVLRQPLPRPALPAGAPSTAMQVSSRLDIRIEAADRPDAVVGARIGKRLASSAAQNHQPSQPPPVRRQMGPLTSAPSPTQGGAKKRMAFVEMALTGPQEAAPLDWIGIEPSPASAPRNATALPPAPAGAASNGNSKGKVGIAR